MTQKFHFLDLPQDNQKNIFTLLFIGPLRTKVKLEDESRYTDKWVDNESDIYIYN